MKPFSEAHLVNIAGHAAVGCGSVVASGGKCGPGAASGAAGSFAGPLMADMGFHKNVVAHAVVGGLASVAGGGNFGNGAVTAAFGYLFNQQAENLARGQEIHELFGAALTARFGADNVRLENSFSWNELRFRTDVILFDRDVFELKPESYHISRDSSRYYDALNKMLESYVPGLNARYSTTRFQAGDFDTYFPRGLTVLSVGNITGRPMSAVRFYGDSARQTGLVFYSTPPLGPPN